MDISDCFWLLYASKYIRETYANIEFAGYQNYYYLKNGKLYRSIREMNHDALGEEVKYLE